MIIIYLPITQSIESLLKTLKKAKPEVLDFRIVFEIRTEDRHLAELLKMLSDGIDVEKIEVNHA